MQEKTVREIVTKAIEQAGTMIGNGIIRDNAVASIHSLIDEKLPKEKDVINACVGGTWPNGYNQCLSDCREAIRRAVMG